MRNDLKEGLSLLILVWHPAVGAMNRWADMMPSVPSVPNLEPPTGLPSDTHWNGEMFQKQTTERLQIELSFSPCLISSQIKSQAS